MKRTAFLALITALAASAAYAQTEEDQVYPQDPVTSPGETSAPAEVPEEEAGEDTEGEAEEVRVPSQPTAVLQSFFGALRTGDGQMVSQLLSDEGLQSIGVMLEILKENLDSNTGLVMSRLTAAGYTATADEVDDWSAMEYLEATVVLPVMKSRYSMYEMEVGEYTISGNSLQVPLTFVTSSGVELPFEADLVKVRDSWKVSTFMGLTSFP